MKTIKRSMAITLIATTVFTAACTKTVYEPAPTFEPVPATVSSADVVDYMEAESPGTVQQFCYLYVQIGDYDVAFAAFSDGYGYGQDPPAEEVFDELLSRC